MFFQHIFDKSLAQASYFIGCQKAGVAMVIDPKRDVDTYLEIAKQNNMVITHVAETHIHADFLSGSRELATMTGAKVYLSDEGGEGWLYEFPHEGLKNNDEITVGNLIFEVIHTPGHTPESISFLLTDTPASPEPVILFTGDFVFVGDVGRPDLLEKAAGIVGTKDEGAKQMYASINKFSTLPDFLQVWPGHGAGSACGKALGAVPSTTVGYEKIRNWAFQHQNDEPGFVKYLLEDQPEPPKYFAMMKHLNKVARPLLTEVPKVPKLAAAAFQNAMDAGSKLIDTRPKADFAAGFIKGSINIQGNNAFATWCGWFMNYQEPIILIASDAQIEDLTRKLMRIGLDNVVGYVNSLDIWVEMGHNLEKSNIITTHEFEQYLNDDGYQKFDIRGLTDYNDGHIAGVEHLFLGTIEQRLDQIDKSKPAIVHCQSGDRSAICYSLLVKHGFENILNYSESINGWLKAGHQLVKS